MSRHAVVAPDRYPSPLRYPGGKGKVANFLKLLILENSLSGIRYVEPYAGGASVALSLLYEELVSHVHINDLNEGVYSFWRLVLDDPERLVSLTMRTRLDAEEWRRHKAIYADPSSSPEELAFATFFLNRTNRSGIIARGGMIGGNNQDGQWKIDARFNRKALCARIRKVARFGSRITISREDAVDLVREIGVKPEPVLMYLDPPYYVKGARLYDNFYSHEDHAKIAATITAAPGPWIVSYDAAPEILELYRDSTCIRYVLGYSASDAASGSEVMYFSRDLVAPSIASPAGISARAVAEAKFLDNPFF